MKTIKTTETSHIKIIKFVLNKTKFYGRLNKMKALVILASVLLVIAAIGVAFAAVPGNTDVGASVTVSAYKDVTVTACDPLAFGTLNPGTNDNPVNCANPEDVKVTNNAISNGNVDVKIKGTDFSDGSHTIAITNAGWDSDNTATTTTAMSTTLGAVGSALTPGQSVSMYFFLDVPSAQTAGAYTSTFTVNTA